jgi:hypothetical protein
MGSSALAARSVKTEEAAAETAFRQLYAAVWLPRVGEGGALDLEKIEVGKRPLQATTVHERVMELLTVGGKPKIFGTLEPGKIVSRMKLGESLAEGEPPRLGVRTKDVVDAFFGFLEPPRISSDAVLRKAIAKGVGKATFAYTTGMPALGPDGKYQVAVSKVVIDRSMTDDEVDLDDGFLIVPAAVPVAAPPTPTAAVGTDTATGGAVLTAGEGSAPTAPAGQPPTVGAVGSGVGKPKIRTSIHIAFPGGRDDVFKSFQAIANLADKSDGGKIQIVIDGQAAGGYDPNWLRNAVQEPLEEANIEGLTIE